jgi:hypothetical protein
MAQGRVLHFGDRIGGYRLGDVLGAGGIGTVYATTGEGGVSLAIKVVSVASDPSIRSRVAREVAALRSLQHPNVLGVVDSGDDGEWSYVVMPRLTGTTLRQLVDGGRLTPESAALLVLYAAHGAGAIHRTGITHRDLKPDNVMITDEGRVIIIDLGLALAPDWTRQTVEGTITGSLPYMAPEQIEGMSAPTSDVWALGVMWWELTTGKRPFARDRAVEEVAAILAGTRAPIGDADRRVSPELGALIEACLAREPERRPPDGNALAARLAPLVSEALASVSVPPPTAVSRLRHDRVRWEGAMATAAANRCAARAEQLAVDGDPFAAMREIDRGLAYCPDDRELSAALSRVIPKMDAVPPQSHVTSLPYAHTAVAMPSAPRPRPSATRSRRKALLLGFGGGAVVAAIGATVAILLLRRGDDRPAIDFTNPTKVVEAIFEAARSGKDDRLASLCLPGEGDGDVRQICEMTTSHPKWDEFRMYFRDGQVIGMSGKGVQFRFGPGGGETEEMQMIYRGGRFYLGSF